jgi:hypothetical protein
MDRVSPTQVSAIVLGTKWLRCHSWISCEVLTANLPRNRNVSADSPSMPRSNTSRNVVLVILVLVVVGMVSYYFYGSSSSSNVSVSGSATTAGSTTNPVSIIFATGTGQVYIAAARNVVGNSSYFSTSLPNFQTYIVTIIGIDALGHLSSCNGGTFSLSEPSGGPGLTESFSCP